MLSLGQICSQSSLSWYHEWLGVSALSDCNRYKTREGGEKHESQSFSIGGSFERQLLRSLRSNDTHAPYPPVELNCRERQRERRENTSLEGRPKDKEEKTGEERKNLPTYEVELSIDS